MTNRARVSSIREVAPNVFEVHAAMVDPVQIAYEPGQYISVHIAGANEHRSYSLASPAGTTDRVVLLVRRMGGVGSQFLADLAIGHTLEFDGPRGDFRLAPGAHDGVFGATGVGVSALFPMMEMLLARPGVRRVMFFWGLMTASFQFWADRLAQLEREPRFSSRPSKRSRSTGW